jgi:hypothetical protein
MRGSVDIAALLGAIQSHVDPLAPLPWVRMPARTKEDDARDAYARVAGVGAAAWLLWKHRAQLRRSGAVDFAYKPSDALPAWFLVAIRCLDLRPHWEVTEVIRPGARAVRVRWKRWKGTP